MNEPPANMPTPTTVTTTKHGSQPDAVTPEKGDGRPK